MAQDYIALLIQVPLVGMFMWFVVRMSGQINEREDARDERWQIYLAEERASTVDALNAVAESLRLLRKQVAQNTAVILYHDATVRGENPETVGSTEEILRRLMGQERQPV